MRQYRVGRDEAGQRADRFLRKAAPDIPSSLLQKTFRLRDVKRDGQRITADTILRAGDEICAYFPEKRPPMAESSSIESIYAAGSVPSGAAGRSPQPRIVYEDAHVLIADKPGGLPSQGNDALGEASAELWLRRYLCQSGVWKPGESRSFLPSLCHRLDKPTGGLLLCAKTGEALRLLTEKIRARELEKGYQALVWGCPEPREGQWRDYVYKDPASSFVTVHRDRASGAKSASLSYRMERVLQGQDGGKPGKAALLSIILHTGRTHQIRVQCASRGHPVLGDHKYGQQKEGQTGERIALCACRLAFPFQGDAGVLSYLTGRVFTIKPDFQEFLSKP